VWRRIKSNDFQTIYELGSTSIVATGGREEKEPGTRKWYSKRPTFRINCAPNNDFKWSVPQTTVTYVADKIIETDRIVGGALSPRTEIGQYMRNKVEEGIVYVQWSNLIPNEAETLVLTKDYEIVAGLITLNINLNWEPVIWQRILAATGMLGSVRPGEFDSIMQNPLPRPRWTCRSPAYRLFCNSGS